MQNLRFSGPGRRLLLTFSAAALLMVSSLSSPSSYGAVADPVAAISLTPEISGFGWLIQEGSLPDGLQLQASQNNIALEFYQGRFYIAFRNAKSHFASDDTKIIVLSSDVLPSDTQVAHWKLEATFFMDSDLREPFFITDSAGELVLSYFQGGIISTKFEPKNLYRSIRSVNGTWSMPEIWGDPHEIAWELKNRNGKYWMTSYVGSHYGVKKGGVDVRFKESADGLHWNSLDPSVPEGTVYSGGVSEVGFEFDDSGNLWGVGRNEDGDNTGFGAQVYYADKNHLGNWSALNESDPRRYDSPRMFKHGSELYLVARRDIGKKPFGFLDRHLPFLARKWIALARYSLRRKRTALYHLNQETRQVEWLMDLPSTGDNAFPSIVKMSEDRYLVANYTSPLKHSGWNWIKGQISREGTQVYWLELKFNN